MQGEFFALSSLRMRGFRISRRTLRTLRENGWWYLTKSGFGGSPTGGRALPKRVLKESTKAPALRSALSNSPL